jgi:hypothetical protein
MKRFIVAGVGVGAALLLAACGPKATPKAAQPGPSVAASTNNSLVPSTAGPSTAPSPAVASSAPPTGTVPPASTVPSTVSSTIKGKGFTSAQAEWKKGAGVSAAQQGAYWTRAANDLLAGEKTDGNGTEAYQIAIVELKDLTSLPDAQHSTAQNVRYHMDIEALDGFFSTPGLYS